MAGSAVVKRRNAAPTVHDPPADPRAADRSFASRSRLQLPALRVLDREPSSLDRARERHLGQASGRGDLVTAKEDAVTSIDRRAIAPRSAREVERTAATVHHLAP